ncbi:NUDIX hydrolase [Halorubrum sp. Atlit-8R]|uniref:NUDIX hydrolase n=1 Tax=unclassified Halorubrum TaxID=2642239 RepID=UPI000EF1DECF|nr:MULTISPECIES: NUDIX hydrolase [unclassified Halorubrum]RLM67359.1 NUDIX hydrolase [Halorubrum sp. Atlit-9R]RLM77519.1 NUDIX hydrolase [Halorubrum sp. Atlit-8R]
MTGDRGGDAGDAPDDAPAADLRDLPAFSDGRSHSLPGEPEWPVREVAVEYDEGWFVGGYDRVEQPDGTEKKYYWAELSPATVIVAVADDRVLFVEQYRPTVRNTQLELPAGVVEAGESYTEAGARELAEETGFAPSSTSLLQEVWCSTGVLRHRRGYVFAEGLEPVDVDHDSNEFLAPRSVPVEEALATARDPPTNDATLEGLLLAEREGLL